MPVTEIEATCPAMERHYSVQEIATLWRVSGSVVRRLFAKREGVLAIAGPTITGRRKYVSLRIPRSVLLRVHEERSGGVLAELQPRRGAI